MTDRIPEAVPGPDKQIITSIYQFAPEALEQHAQWLEQRGLRTPVGQVVGFQQFLAGIKEVLAYENSGSTTYVDLTTPGPTIDKLSAGRYLLLFGAQIAVATDGGTNTFATRMSPNINATTPSDNDAVSNVLSIGGTGYVSLARATVKDLTLDNNTVKMQYRVSGGSVAGSWGQRWLIALRVSNIR